MSNAPPSTGPLKRASLRKLLRDDTVMVILDGRHPGVVLPEWLRAEPQVCLDLGYDMPIPIPDLELHEAHIQATLSFSRRPFRCVIPWEAVYALRPHRSDEGMLWPHDVPPELLSGAEAPEGRTAAKRNAPAAGRPRGARATTSGAASPSPAPRGDRAHPAWLQLVPDEQQAWADDGSATAQGGTVSEPPIVPPPPSPTRPALRLVK
jgi:hypothetical protein